jgi:hypothetical protein
MNRLIVVVTLCMSLAAALIAEPRLFVVKSPNLRDRPEVAIRTQKDAAISLFPTDDYIGAEFEFLSFASGDSTFYVQMPARELVSMDDPYTVGDSQNIVVRCRSTKAGGNPTEYVDIVRLSARRLTIAAELVTLEPIDSDRVHFGEYAIEYAASGEFLIYEDFEAGTLNLTLSKMDASKGVFVDFDHLKFQSAKGVPWGAYLQTNDDKVNLRSGPGTSYLALQQLSKGDGFEFVRINPEAVTVGGSKGYWVFVKTDARWGWVFSPFIL